MVYFFSLEKAPAGKAPLLLLLLLLLSQLVRYTATAALIV